MASFIAVDWGTTNRRAYRVEDGRIVAAHKDDLGVKAMASRDYAAEVHALRQRLGDLPMLLAGMVGSSIGWRNVPYVAAPASLDDLAAGAARIDERTIIVPGLVDPSGPDVMRGEEVQMLGAHAAALVPADALLCQPGTHCKWATLENGRIAGFRTAMTGELFALLKDHSILAAQLVSPVADDAAFAQGVAASGADLLSALFGVRAASVLGQRDDRCAASYASGLLIGSDVGVRDVAGRTVHLLADPLLGSLYARAVELLGGRAVSLDSTTAFIAGATALQELCR